MKGRVPLRSGDLQKECRKIDPLLQNGSLIKSFYFSVLSIMQAVENYEFAESWSRFPPSRQPLRIVRQSRSNTVYKPLHNRLSQSGGKPSFRMLVRPLLPDLPHTDVEWDQVALKPRGPKTMMAAPSRQIAMPRMSHRSGCAPSTAHNQKIDAVM